MGVRQPKDSDSVGKTATTIAMRLFESCNDQRLVLVHGAVVVILLCWAWWTGKFGGPAAMLIGGLIPAQACLIAIWAAWSGESVAARWSDAVWRLALVYPVFLLWVRPHWGALPMAAFIIVLFAATVWLPAWILRWFGWRLVHAGSTSQPSQRWQFRRADIWKWAILLCIVLGVAWQLPFKPRTGMDFRGAFLMLWSVFVCLPTGVASIILCWTILHPKTNSTRANVLGALAGAWVVLSGFAALAMVLSLANERRSDEISALVQMAVVSSLVLVSTAGALRLSGWTLELGRGLRITVTNSSD